MTGLKKYENFKMEIDMAKYLPIIYDSATKTHRPVDSDEVIVPEAIPVKSGENNLLKVTEEGLEATLSVEQDDDLLWIDRGKLKTGLDCAYNTTNGTIDIINHAGTVIASVKIPTTKMMLEDVALLFVDALTQIRDDDGNLLPVGAYLHFIYRKDDNTIANVYLDVTRLLNEYTAGGGISIVSNVISADLSENNNALVLDGSGKMFVPKVKAFDLVDPNDKILVAPSTGEQLSTALRQTYDDLTGELKLIGKNDEVLSVVTVTSFSSSLESVELVKDPVGRPAGYYLVMTFRLRDGTTDTVYVDVSALSDIYTAGQGVNITDYTVSAKLDGAGGLKFTENGLAVDLAALTPLLVNALISADSDNLIKPGTDGKLYAPADCGVL